jgi:photosystem II stability/assembly factor-like uncharacterized protein
MLRCHRVLTLFAALPLVCAIVSAQANQERPSAPPSATASPAPKPHEENKVEEENPKDPLFAGMQYRLIGPFRGGRSIAVTGVPGQPNVFYFGAVGGGVWKTTNAAVTWEPVFDKEDVSAIGAIAVAPSDPNVVYAGSGEACIRGNVAEGDGIYKSTDGGKTWKNVGLRDTRSIGAVIVDPKDPNIVFVAAMGHVFGPNAERGVFRSRDGGATWQKVLYKDENTGAVDVVFDPNNSNILFASLWQARRAPWGFTSGGPGSGLYRSADGGSTWKQLSAHGLPEGPWGRVGVAVGANSERVYALIEAKQGGLYRSDDGGEKWELVNPDHRLWQRAWYYMHVVADPKDADKLYVMDVQFLRSTDGGHTFNTIHPPHGDNHSLWIDPHDTNRMIEGNDGGATVSTDGGKTWTTELNQPTAQFYHVITDNRFPYYVYGAQQDNSTIAIASRSDTSAIDRENWYTVGGGESGYVAPDPRDPDIVYSGGYEGQIERFDKHTGQGKEITVFPVLTDAHGAAHLEHRFQWTAPVLISPHDPSVLYHAGERVFKSTDGGMHWTAISPDLTRNDKSRQQPAGGPVQIDDTGTEYYDTIFALAESPKQAGVLWAGTDDGLVQLTRDAGQHWENVTPKDLPAWSRVSLIEASPFDAGTVYVAANRYEQDDDAPYLFRSSDYGRTWTKIVNGIPNGAFLRAVREDPVRRGLLYAGTEKGVYVSFDDGAHWRPLKLNLPTVSVRDLVVHGNDLVVATHGRAFWILDDVSPLRQFKSPIEKDDAFLYQPSEALRIQAGRGKSKSPVVGKNPPPGAIIYFYLKDKPKGETTLEILDSGNHVVRQYSSARLQPLKEPPDPDDKKPKKQLEVKKGLNRWVWDLRYDDATRVPGYYLYEYGDGAIGPLALPGKYTVRVTADGKSYAAPLDVGLDPRVKVSAADLQKQFVLLEEIRDQLSRLYGAVNEMRDVRKQIADLRGRFPKSVSFQPIDTAGQDLDRKIEAVQDKLVNLKVSADEDSLAYPLGLDGDLAYLSMAVASESDSAPTEAEYQTYEQLKKRVDDTVDQWRELVKTDIPGFQKLVLAQSPAPIVVPMPGSAVVTGEERR